MYYFDPNLILIIILSIIAGGLMKGILGLGMPMVAVPVIAYFLPPTIKPITKKINNGRNLKLPNPFCICI